MRSRGGVARSDAAPKPQRSPGGVSFAWYEKIALPPCGEPRGRAGADRQAECLRGRGGSSRRDSRDRLGAGRHGRPKGGRPCSKGEGALRQATRESSSQARPSGSCFARSFLLSQWMERDHDYRDDGIWHDLPRRIDLVALGGPAVLHVEAKGVVLHRRKRINWQKSQAAVKQIVQNADRQGQVGHEGRAQRVLLPDHWQFTQALRSRGQLAGRPTSPTPSS